MSDIIITREHETPEPQDLPVRKWTVDIDYGAKLEIEFAYPTGNPDFTLTDGDGNRASVELRALTYPGVGDELSAVITVLTEARDQIEAR